MTENWILIQITFFSTKKVKLDPLLCPRPPPPGLKTWVKKLKCFSPCFSVFEFLQKISEVNYKGKIWEKFTSSRNSPSWHMIYSSAKQWTINNKRVSLHQMFYDCFELFRARKWTESAKKIEVSGKLCLLWLVKLRETKAVNKIWYVKNQMLFEVWREIPFLSCTQDLSKVRLQGTFHIN